MCGTESACVLSTDRWGPDVLRPVLTEWPDWVLRPQVVALDRRQVRVAQVAWQVVGWNAWPEWAKVIQIIPEWVACNGRQRQRGAWVQQIVETVAPCTWTPHWQSCRRYEKRCARLCAGSIILVAISARGHSETVEGGMVVESWKD